MTPLQLPFAHLNLRRNPFGLALAEERGRLAVGVDELDRFIPRLQKPGFALQLMGDHGRGKSTRLRALWDRFDGAPYIRAKREAKRFRPPNAPVIFIDEGQFLSRRQRRRLLSAPSSYVVATHESYVPAFKRAGLDYECLTIAGVDEALLAQILARRLEWARRSPGPLPQITAPAVRALIARYGDNIRAIELHLYEVFQRLEERCDVEVQHLDLIG